MATSELRTHDEGPARTQTAGRKTKRWWWVAGALLIALGVGWRVVAARANARQEAQGNAPRVVSVVLTAVRQEDVPIVLEGLGTVTPLASVTVKSQVDGRLEKVFFTEGQNVKKGDLLAQIDPRPFRIMLQQAQGALERDQATLRNAELDLQRYQELRTRNLIAQQQADTQKATVAQARGTVEVDQAAVNNAQLQLDYARIVAPMDGVTGVRQVDPGNLIHATDANGLLVLTQLDPIAVIFTLPQDVLPRVSKAMSERELTVDAYNRDGTVKLATGKVLLIDNQINTNTATLRLKAIFPNPQRVLWPNLFVKARLLLDTEKNAVVVPAVAIQRGSKGPFVYVAAPDGTAAMRTVQIKRTEGELTLIGSGVQPGEKVVTEGQNQLSPGAHIQPRTEDARAQAP
jgi:multidrug efflux system membrane fusion protein